MSWTKCATKTCNDLATVRVFWPGQTSDMCPQCALRAKGVAAAMGFALSVAIIVPPDRESGDSIPAAAPADGSISRGPEGAGRPDAPVLNKSGGSDVVWACGKCGGTEWSGTIDGEGARMYCAACGGPPPPGLIK